MTALLLALNLSAQLERAQVEDQYKWNLTDIFPSDEAWYTAKDALVKEMERVDDFKGTLTRTSKDLLEALAADEAGGLHLAGLGRALGLARPRLMAPRLTSSGGDRKSVV